MKILLTTLNIHRPTGLRAFINIANALHRRGHEVMFLVDKKSVREGQRPFYPLDDEVEIRNARPWDDEPVRETLPQLWRRLRRRVRLLLHRNVHSRAHWEAKFEPKIDRLRAAFREIDPDVVIAFLPSTFTYAAKALEGSRAAFLLANRNSPFRDYTEARYEPSRYDVAMRFEAAEACTLNLVQLEAYKEIFSSEVQEKTRVIPNWVEWIPDDAIAHPGIEEETNVILSVGRLHEQKNHVLLIESFAKIADRHPGWEVAIAGAGKLEPKLQQRIDELGLTGRVRLLGARKDMEALYASSKVFAFPSRWEGFSNAHLEAMVHNLPSLGLESCIYMREITERSKGGLLASDDVDDYAEKLERLIEDPAERAQLGANARQFARQFERESIVDQWEAVLEEARQKAEAGA